MGVVYECAPVLIGIYPVVTVNPTMPTIPNTTPLGTVVAVIAVVNSDGSAFMGSVTFGPPNGSDGGIYALTGSGGSYNLIVNPAGPGVGSQGGQLNRVNVVANL